MSLPPADQANTTVLIVDDDSAIIVALGKALQSLAHTVYATNGEDALERGIKSSPDLILLDMEMPGMSGLEVCKYLKARVETADIPVIFITSHAEPGIEEMVFEAGAVDYIAKPLNPRVVSARVKTHLGYRQALTQLSQSKTSLELYNQQLKETNTSLQQIQSDLKTELDISKGHRQRLVAQLSESVLNKSDLVQANASLISKIVDLNQENLRLNNYMRRHLADLERHSVLQNK